MLTFRYSLILFLSDAIDLPFTVFEGGYLKVSRYLTEAHYPLRIFLEHCYFSDMKDFALFYIELHLLFSCSSRHCDADVTLTHYFGVVRKFT